MSHRWDSRTNLDHLRYLTITQLRELLEDEERIQCFVCSSKKLQDLWRQNELNWASNRQLADRNLSYRPHLKNTKLLLAEKNQLLQRVLSSIRRKQRKLESLRGRPSLRSTQRFLKQRLAHFTEDPERLWRKFLEGNLPLADFLMLFQSSRTFYYRHLVQVEKIQDLSSRTPEQRPGALPTAGLLSNGLHLPTASNVFYSFSPVVMLPAATFLPLLRPAFTASHLPPLINRSDEGLWAPFIPVNNQMSWPYLQQQTKNKRPKHSRK